MITFLFRPRVAFARSAETNTSVESFGLLHALIITGVVLAVMVGVLLIAELVPKVQGGSNLNRDAFGQAFQDGTLPTTPDGRPVTQPVWFAKLILFPLLWALFIAYATGTRWIFARILGESQASSGGSYIAMVSAIAAWPLILLGGTLSAINTWIPHEALAGGGDATPVLIGGRLGLSVLVFLIGWGWEGAIASAGLQERLGQNRGRALLTWLAPYVGCVGITLGLNLFFS